MTRGRGGDTQANVVDSGPSQDCGLLGRPNESVEVLIIVLATWYMLRK